jgi:hypothetical protein
MSETSSLRLSDAARCALDCSDAHRIALIDRDLWIGYGRARDAHVRLERILRSERRMRPDNLLIVGASNNGKTAIARRFLAHHTNAEDPDAERSRIETALVQAPNGPSIPQLLRSILTALGREPGPRPTSVRLRAEVHGAMRDVGLRLLLIDDLHNIRGSRIGGMLVELREIGSITGVSIGAFATKEIAHVFRLDEQLANRFALLTLPRHILTMAGGLIACDRLRSDVESWLPATDSASRRCILNLLTRAAATGADPIATLRDGLRQWFGTGTSAMLPRSPSPIAAFEAATIAFEPLMSRRRRSAGWRGCCLPSALGPLARGLARPTVACGGAMSPFSSIVRAAWPATASPISGGSGAWPLALSV